MSMLDDENRKKVEQLQDNFYSKLSGERGLTRYEKGVEDILNRMEYITVINHSRDMTDEEKQQELKREVDLMTLQIAKHEKETAADISLMSSSAVDDHDMETSQKFIREYRSVEDHRLTMIDLTRILAPYQENKEMLGKAISGHLTLNSAVMKIEGIDHKKELEQIMSPKVSADIPQREGGAKVQVKDQPKVLNKKVVPAPKKQAPIRSKKIGSTTREAAKTTKKRVTKPPVTIAKEVSPLPQASGRSYRSSADSGSLSPGVRPTKKRAPTTPKKMSSSLMQSTKSQRAREEERSRSVQMKEKKVRDKKAQGKKFQNALKKRSSSKTNERSPF